MREIQAENFDHEMETYVLFINFKKTYHLYKGKGKRHLYITQKIEDLVLNWVIRVMIRHYVILTRSAKKFKGVVEKLGETAQKMQINDLVTKYDMHKCTVYQRIILGSPW